MLHLTSDGDCYPHLDATRAYTQFISYVNHIRCAITIMID
jgi:hypothetical protein